ncbi:MAG: T9SS type A sorting domain-containing protein [Bacteroidetes bacterium]|nr:T9SS type A sorting domain-containing protein [Bacteroidota bacterium]
MNAPQYRNFGSYQTIMGCYTVNLDTAHNENHAGIQWYEFQKTGGNPWSVRQQGTYCPDSESRWMGSIRLNGDHTIGMGYSVSGNNTYPSIRYCGQSKTAYALANSIMDYTEDTIVNGRFSQSGSFWWGSYSGLVVDPSNDKAFWYTNEYIDSANNRATRIASFRFGKYPLVTTLPASNITINSVTLNGSVNPNGLATTWHFEWGTSTSYGDSSANVDAGSGITTLPVNFNLSGLGFGITYHYRLVGDNSEGRMEGNDLTVIPGAAVIITRGVSSIEMNSAVSGGEITSDGGSPVTERGVCWGKNVNPVVSGRHTTDGQGIGSFISQIDSLERNTIYHVRAFATNSYGPWYGQDRTFVTLCGNYSLPFNESFYDPWLPQCWTIVDHKGNSQVWSIGIMTYGDPLPALDGNYAYIDSESYGSNGMQNTDLVTPVIDCSAYINVYLSFKQFYNSYPNSSAEVAYSINGGLSWTSLLTFNSTSSTNPETYSTNVPDVSGKSKVMFRWNYKGAFSHYWAVDDIHINGDKVNMLGVTPAIQKVSAGPASTAIFTVQSNTGWNATSNQPWITVTPSGSFSGILLANYQENLTHQSRTADISVSVPGRPPVVVYVEQERSTLGIEEKPDDHIVIYPNPTNGFITLVPSLGPVNDLKVFVWDTQGRPVLNRELKGSKEYTLDLTSAAEGIYFIQVSTETWTVTRKISIVKP